MRVSDGIRLFEETQLQEVLVCKKLCVTSLLALVKSSESVPTLRLLPPPTVHFKIRVPVFALALWDLLANAGLGLHGSDVGAGLERGKDLSWSWFRF